MTGICMLAMLFMLPFIQLTPSCLKVTGAVVVSHWQNPLMPVLHSQCFHAPGRFLTAISWLSTRLFCLCMSV